MEIRTKRYKDKRIYKILCAIKIKLHGWSQTACSKLALVLL